MQVSPVRWTSPSVLALIGANLVPLAGVLLWGWSLTEIMMLYWAESAVVGVYSMLKMIVTDMRAVILLPFFVVHYGGFMLGHFFFIQTLFIAPLQGPMLEVVGPAIRSAVMPLRWALAALFVSHGISFLVHFIGRKEYKHGLAGKFMMEPYGRIFVMHLTLILGGWFALALKAPAVALLALVVIKIWVDLQAHTKQHDVNAVR